MEQNPYESPQDAAGPPTASSQGDADEMDEILERFFDFDSLTQKEQKQFGLMIAAFCFAPTILLALIVWLLSWLLS